MGQVINTNVLSLNAQRNLDRTQGDLAQALQRLSSGLRINSAKDDAAGLAISERFTTQIRGINQAVRNSNDGISLAQTSESALGEVTNNLQRIRELAVQSANSTNSASDRAALDQEVQQRIAEIERVASQTAFNGLKVLDGTFGVSQFQVGANAGETITVNLSQGVRTTQIGQIASQTSSTEVTTGALGGTGTIQVGSTPARTIGASVAGTDGGQTVGSAFAKKVAIDAASVPGLTVAATNNVELVIADVVDSDTDGTYELSINGQTIINNGDLEGSTITAGQIADAINAQSDNTGVTAALSGTDLRLSSVDGRDIIIGETSAGTSIAGGITAGAGGASTVNGIEYRDGTIGTAANATAFGTDADAVNGGTLTFSATENILIATDGLAYGLASADVTIALDTTTLSSVNVSTVADANDAIQRLDAALTSVSGLRSTFGAIQNRFESTIANLTAVSENLSASRSRILDADFAAETAALTRAQILQQAGTAILAQANASPQTVLGLLQ
ncbi:MAG: flagellin [Gammaproteobacteria bacterium]